MNRINTNWIAAALVISGLAGCTRDTDPLGSAYVKSSLIGSLGGSLAVTQADCDGQSNKCPFVGTSIVIPRTALAQDTMITIGAGEDATERNGTVTGPALEFGPAGTTFSSPVEITLPITNELEKDLLRVYVTQADGTKSVLMPYQLAYDRTAKQVRFLVTHFTTFQCGGGTDPCSDVANCPGNDCSNGTCTDACDPSECGPQPGVPSWTCDDGTGGGFNGECVRNADGSCAWVIDDCPNPCTVVCDPNGQCDENCNPGCGGQTCPAGSVCDPATNSCVDDCICPDGTACAIDSNGGVHCGGGNGCTDNTPCPDGSTCDPATGACNPGCVCPDGQACTTDPNGGGTRCENQGCNAGVACPPDSTCDPATGTCTGACTCPDGQACVVDSAGNAWCGNNGCDANQPCPAGSVCDPATNTCVNDCICPDNTPCSMDPNGTVSCEPVAECDATACGPQPGIPNWICDDGTPGGPTGRCLPTADGTCGWEIIWCEPACDANACGNQPPPTDPNDVCPDGTIPPYVCRHNANGACAWEAGCVSDNDGN